jgi:hypothetical protein
VGDLKDLLLTIGQVLILTLEHLGLFTFFGFRDRFHGLGLLAVIFVGVRAFKRFCMSRSALSSAS